MKDISSFILILVFTTIIETDVILPGYYINKSCSISCKTKESIIYVPKNTIIREFKP